MRLMIPFHDVPIGRKLMLIGLLTTSLALFSVSLILVSRGWVDWRDKTVSEMESYAALIGANAAPSMIFADYDAAMEVLRTVSKNPDIVDAALYDRDGRVFARYHAPEHSKDAFPFINSDSYLFSFDQLVVSKPVMLKGKTWGTVYLESDLRGLYAEIKRQALLTFIAATGVFMVTLFLFFRLQKAIVGPVTNLSGVMRQVSARRDYAVRVPVHGKDEVGVLADAFNDMLAQIQVRDEELERHRVHLEEEVVLRTAELRENNRLLELELVERKRAEVERRRLNEAVRQSMVELTQANAELRELNAKLVQAQSQLVQSEKMASIGLLAAGVAHEINNPIGYIRSNLGALENYIGSFIQVLDAYEKAERSLPGRPDLCVGVVELKRKMDFDYIKQDVMALLHESHEGVERVTRIVQDLKDFSRIEAEEQWVRENIHHGIDSTLNVIWNELKYKCEVVKEYGELPDIDCLPSQLNQVFMNLLVNAAQAIETRGTITIRTGQEDDRVWVEVSDTGQGVLPENIPHLFDPFFTTKPVGKGTGLGLSVSYNIVEKHHGKIEVQSEIGKGTSFRVWLPIKQKSRENA